MQYDFELDRVKEEIKKKGAKLVLIQLPEGLKSYTKQIMDKLKETDAALVLSGDQCYGACDIVSADYDLTIHFGHSKMLDDPKVIYVECRMKESKTIEALKGKELDGESIGLVTTCQHIHELPDVEKVLEKKGKKVIIGKKGPKTTYNGQVLGCDWTAATSIAKDVDLFLFIGSGRFHPLGVACATGKKVVQLNPYTGGMETFDGTGLEKEKHLRIAKARGAKSFGVVVGTKPGQRNWEEVERAKKKLEEKGFEVFMIEMGEITPEKIDHLPFDAFVICACPRLVLDDWKNFKKPILLANEIEELKSF